MARNRRAIPWTADEWARVQQALDEGLTVAQAARRTGIDRARIHNRLRGFGGIRRPYSRRIGEPLGEEYWATQRLDAAEARWAAAMSGGGRYQSISVTPACAQYREPMPENAREL